MMNPDGVVLGNYRSSALGLDLNRLFKKKLNPIIIPEIKYI